MKLSFRRKLFVGAIGLTAVLWAADEYPALRFRGDGKVFGGPVLGYDIEFQKIPFNRSGVYTFHFRGMPNEEMRLLVRVEGKTSNGVAELRLKNVIEARLSTENNQMVCEASGRPVEVGPDSNDHFVLMEGNCNGIQFCPRTRYILYLRIRDVDSRTPAINLVPYFEGGQPDLT